MPLPAKEKTRLGPLTLLALFTALLTLAVWRRSSPDTQGSPPETSQQPSLPPQVRLERPRGSIVYLVDVSASTKTGGQRSPFAQAMPLLDSTVRALWDLPQALPQRHIVAVIGAVSAGQNAICEFTLSRGNLFTPRDSVSVFTTVKECVDSIAGLRSASSTDIRGALQYAGFVLEGAAEQELRGIVLFTDLKEELLRGQEPATPNLRGVCIAAFIEITPETATKPSLLEDRKTYWQNLLNVWGAKRSLFRTVPGFDRSQVLQFFRECSKK